MFTFRLYMAKDFSLCFSFFKGVISSTLVFEMSRFSSWGRSDATISSPWRLKSVLLTFKVCRACNLASATTTQYLEKEHMVYKDFIRVVSQSSLIVNWGIMYRFVGKTTIDSTFLKHHRMGSLGTMNILGDHGSIMVWISSAIIETSFEPILILLSLRHY